MSDQSHDPPPAAAVRRRPDRRYAQTSLVVCVRGDLAGLERALDAVRLEKRRPLEIVIVDQAAAGLVAAILDRFRELPLVHVVCGAGDTATGRRLGRSLARGTAVAFVDGAGGPEAPMGARVRPRARLGSGHERSRGEDGSGALAEFAGALDCRT